MRKILVIHGPNLNLLGTREVDVYGSVTIDDINKDLKKCAKSKGISLEIMQSNHEGGIVEKMLIAPVVNGQVSGFGKMSYLLGLEAAISLIKK